MRSVLKRVGGKGASAKEHIIPNFPGARRYQRYVEPCGGAAHVLLAKPPYDHAEIFNDADDNLMAFWLMMKEQPEAMRERLEAYPYSRMLYRLYYPTLFDGSEMSLLERAVRYFYVLRGTGTGWVRKSMVGWQGDPSSITSYHSALALFAQVSDRIARVSIDNRDVLATIARYDTPTTLFYVDPPYMGVEFYYEPSKKGFPHAQLAAVLNAAQGMVALSYYPHPDLAQMYPPDRWRVVSWQQHKSSQIQLARLDVATELLLMNYAPDRVDLWTV